MEMRRLSESQGESGLPAFYSAMPLLRGSADSGDWAFADTRERMFKKEKSSPERLDEIRPLGAGDSGTGERAKVLPAGRWPGKRWGARRPDQDETPLSEEEALILARELA